MSRVVALAAALVVGAIVLAATGANPFVAYVEIFKGALGPDGIGDTLSQLLPVAGMAVAVAIPLRAGLVNLGGDGQLALGGITTAVVALHSPLPGWMTLVLALAAGVAAGALYAGLAAVLDNKLKVPLLVSSLLLSYPAMSLASYLVRFPLRDKDSSLPQTEQLDLRLPTFGSSSVSVGLLLVIGVAVAYFVIDARTPAGFEVRMFGRNPRFAAYAGVGRERLALRLMLASGGISGLVGAILVLSFPYRFIDGALITPGYTWTGLLAALLAAAAPLGTFAAAALFAGLTVGGFGMERATDVPRELTAVLQALIIVVLAARIGPVKRRRGEIDRES